jgi:hypothetical protein
VAYYVFCHAAKKPSRYASATVRAKDDQICLPFFGGTNDLDSGIAELRFGLGRDTDGSLRQRPSARLLPRRHGPHETPFDAMFGRGLTPADRNQTTQRACNGHRGNRLR